MEAEERLKGRNIPMSYWQSSPPPPIKLNKQTEQLHTVLLCIEVADRATFLASNRDLGTLLSSENSLFIQLWKLKKYIWLCIITSLVLKMLLFKFLPQNYTVPGYICICTLFLAQKHLHGSKFSSIEPSKGLSLQCGLAHFLVSERVQHEWMKVFLALLKCYIPEALI